MPTRTQPSDPYQLIGLTDVCAALRALGVAPPPGGIRYLQTKAASAAFPAEKHNLKWFVRRGDLPRVAACYGAKMPDGVTEGDGHVTP